MSKNVQFSSVSGKPRQSQEVLPTEKRKYSSGRPEKTVTNALMKESKDKLTDSSYRGSSQYSMDAIESSQASTVQKNDEAGCSPNIDQDYIHHEKCVAGHSLESDQNAVSREDGEAQDTDQVSDFQESKISALSWRSHSSAKSSSTSTWSIRRTSVSSDTDMCSPVQRPRLFPLRSVPTHHPASNPAESESAADVGFILVS